MQVASLYNFTFTYYYYFPLPQGNKVMVICAG